MSASAGSKPVSSSALSSTLSAGSLCACSLPTIAPRRRLTTGGGNAQWLPLQAGRVTTAETLPRARLTLRFPDGQAWTPGEQPDVLIFPGGEVTPFQLRIDAAMGINVDAQGDSQPLAAREQP